MVEIQEKQKSLNEISEILHKFPSQKGKGAQKGGSFTGTANDVISTIGRLGPAKLFIILLVIKILNKLYTTSKVVNTLRHDSERIPDNFISTLKGIGEFQTLKSAFNDMKTNYKSEISDIATRVALMHSSFTPNIIKAILMAAIT